MTTFALVHGAWHGAWCWEKLTPLLREAGHDVVAPELPGGHSPQLSRPSAVAEVVLRAAAR